MQARALAIGLAFLGLATGNGLAADLPVKAAAPLPAAGFNWTGWYLGIGGGYQTGTATGSAVAGFNVQPSFWYIGVTGGYRLQLLDRLVLGLDVSAPIWASTSTFIPPGGVASLKPEFIVAPEVQLGYAIGRWLPFVGVGVGVADIKATAGPPTVSVTNLVPEYMFTAGVNYAATDHVIVGARYDHVVLEQHNYSFPTAPPTIAQMGGNSDGVTAVIEYKW